MQVPNTNVSPKIVTTSAENIRRGRGFRSFSASLPRKLNPDIFHLKTDRS